MKRKYAEINLFYIVFNANGMQKKRANFNKTVVTTGIP
jgi:hypothetical protein